MPLTPQDINKKEFKRTMRGYHTEEVDDFLDQVTRDFEAHVRDLNASREQVARLEDKLSHYLSLIHI